jgi:hypothetical protein
MKTFISVIILFFSIGFLACSDAPENTNTHTHDDGSVHEDHAADTARPDQQQFNAGDSSGVSADSSAKPHVHEDGTEHSH